MALLGTGACSNLPDDGPTAKAVAKGAAAAPVPYAIVNIDPRVIDILLSHPAQPMTNLARISSEAPNDLIEPGDVLSISIYQPGAAAGVLGGGASDELGRSQIIGAPTPGQALPRIVIGRDGLVPIPFAGEVNVAGLTPGEAGYAIRRALRGRAVNPQVIVSVLSSPANSVTVIGEVKNSGRYAISANNDRLLDVIADAGGATHPPADLVVTVSRRGEAASIPLADLMNSVGQNIRLAPGDEVRVMLHQREVNALGALGRVSQFPIEDDTLTLAGALGRLGGLDTNAANPSAVFVFRFERPDVAQALGVQVPTAVGNAAVPIVYRLDLRQGDGYFLAARFDVHADDLIDVPRANTTEVQKFFAIVNASTQTAVQAAVISTAVP